jgi:hypothetical protein
MSNVDPKEVQIRQVSMYMIEIFLLLPLIDPLPQHHTCIINDIIIGSKLIGNLRILNSDNDTKALCASR